MKITLIVVGKTKSREIRHLCEDYFERIKRYVLFEKIEIPDIKNTKNFSETEMQKQEGSLILKKIEDSDYIFLLDEKGKSYPSLDFAKHLQKRMNAAPKRIVFIIGGAYGFDEKIYARANEKLALSKMTFSHQIIRAIFAEQLYRAFSILNNEPYHHQ